MPIFGILPAAKQAIRLCSGGLHNSPIEGIRLQREAGSHNMRGGFKIAVFVAAAAICHAASAVAFTPPPESAIPTGPLGDSIKRGEQIFTATDKYAGPFVGNNLNCSNCHLDQGRKAGSIPMWGAWPLYPQFRTKNGKVNTMALRIQECFLYSMNGKKPPADSDTITDLQSYFAWLATGAPTGMTLGVRAIRCCRHPKIRRTRSAARSCSPRIAPAVTAPMARATKPPPYRRSGDRVLQQGRGHA